MNRIMKIIISFVVLILFSFAMLGIGVYAAEQGLISFMGDENLRQTEEISKKDEKIAQLENNQSEPNPPTNDDLIGAFSKIKAGVIHSIIDNNLTEDETEKLIDDIEVKIENLEDELEDFEDDIEACFDEHEKDKEK